MHHQLQALRINVVIGLDDFAIKARLGYFCKGAVVICELGNKLLTPDQADTGIEAFIRSRNFA